MGLVTLEEDTERGALVKRNLEMRRKLPKGKKAANEHCDFRSDNASELIWSQTFWHTI